MPKFCSMWFLLLLLTHCERPQPKRWMQSHIFSANGQVIYVQRFLSLTLCMFRNAFSCGNLSCWAWNCVCFSPFVAHKFSCARRGSPENLANKNSTNNSNIDVDSSIEWRQKNGIKMVLIECDETAKSEWSWKILKNTLSMSNVFSSFRQMAYNTNWQPSSDFLLKCLHVCYWCCLCILFGCQKIIYFVYGISWHWIYGQTIEPPGNSFSLCAHQTPNNCNENAAKPTAAMPYWTDSVYNILFVSLIPPENVCSEWIEIAISMPMTISQPTTRQIILIIHLSIVTIVLRWTHNNINFLFCVLSGRRKNKFNDPEMVIVCNFIVDELSVSLDFSSFIEPVLWPRPIVISDFTNT